MTSHEEVQLVVDLRLDDLEPEMEWLKDIFYARLSIGDFGNADVSSGSGLTAVPDFFGISGPASDAQTPSSNFNNPSLYSLLTSLDGSPRIQSNYPLPATSPQHSKHETINVGTICGGGVGICRLVDDGLHARLIHHIDDIIQTCLVRHH